MALPENKRPSINDVVFFQALTLLFNSSHTLVVYEDGVKHYWISYKLIKSKLPMLFEKHQNNSIYKKLKSLHDINLISINHKLSKKLSKTFISLTPLGEKFLTIDLDEPLNDETQSVQNSVQNTHGGSDDLSDPTSDDLSDPIFVNNSNPTKSIPNTKKCPQKNTSDDSSDGEYNIYIEYNIIINLLFILPINLICKNFLQAKSIFDQNPQKFNKYLSFDMDNLSATLQLPFLSDFPRFKILSLQSLDNIPPTDFDALKSLVNDFSKIENTEIPNQIFNEYSQIINNKLFEAINNLDSNKPVSKNLNPNEIHNFFLNNDNG